MEASQRCAYPSKPCSNKRSYKDDGTFHRLCTLHRLKANDAQRRWHARQRLTTSEPSSSSDECDPAPRKRRRVTAPRQGSVAIKITAPHAANASPPVIERMPSPVFVETSWFDVPAGPSCEPQCDPLLDDDWITDFFAEMDGFLDATQEPLGQVISTSIYPVELHL